jgi:hypothetical protein
MAWQRFNTELAATIALHSQPPQTAQKPERTRQSVPPDPNAILLTLAQAAHRLGMSEKTLRAHVKAKRIDYANAGHGKEREHIMFAPRYLDDFVATRYKNNRYNGSTEQTEKRAAEAIEREVREHVRQRAYNKARGTMTLNDAAVRYWQEAGQHQAGAANVLVDLE